VALSDLHIVGELEILGERKGVRAGDDSERLKVVHRERVLGVYETADKLGKDVERDLDSRDGVDDSNGNDEDLVGEISCENVRIKRNKKIK
jgi:hypothetical protein